MTKREEFVSQMKAKLDEWNAEIDKLEAQARQQQAQAKQDYAAQIATLKEKRDEAAEKLQQIQNASEDAWENLKAGTQQIWNEVKQTYEETKNAVSK